MSYTGYSIKTNADLAQEISDRQAAVAAEATLRASAISSAVAPLAVAATVASDISTAVAAEATARASAITSAVDAEATARGVAISSAVSDEATARDSAIASAVNAESVARSTAITNAIATEVSDRDAAILVESNARAAAVSAEATARTAAISAAIQQEVSDRDTAISSAVSGLGSSGDITALDTRLSSLESWQTANTDTLQGAIDDAIASNTTLIGSVETALQNADSALITGINQHLSDRHASDQSIKTAIDQSATNDSRLTTVLTNIVNYLDAFSQTYTITDSNGNVVQPPSWSGQHFLLGQVLTHSATITESTPLS